MAKQIANIWEIFPGCFHAKKEEEGDRIARKAKC